MMSVSGEPNIRTWCSCIDDDDDEDDNDEAGAMMVNGPLTNSLSLLLLHH